MFQQTLNTTPLSVKQGSNQHFHKTMSSITSPYWKHIGTTQLHRSFFTCFPDVSEHKTRIFD